MINHVTKLIPLKGFVYFICYKTFYRNISNRCISHLTVENKKPEFAKLLLVSFQTWKFVSKNSVEHASTLQPYLFALHSHAVEHFTEIYIFVFPP